MLSKSQARAFFVWGTAAFSAVFIGLTVDTFQRIPTQTNVAEMNEQVIRGKHLFDVSNCMGCHTIMGEGAYYAPELTKVFERRGETYIKAILRDPDAMSVGQKKRRMTNYKFSEAQINDLTAFLTWIGTMDLNGFPPKPPLAQDTQSVAALSLDSDHIGKPSRPPVFDQLCITCHALEGKGGLVGPALDGVSGRMSREEISQFLKDPFSVKADSKMPKLPLTGSQIEDLVNFLSEKTVEL